MMDHFAGKPTTFDVEDSWKADMQAAAGYAGLSIKVSDVHNLSSQAVTGLPASLAHRVLKTKVSNVLVGVSQRGHVDLVFEFLRNDKMN